MQKLMDKLITEVGDKLPTVEERKAYQAGVLDALEELRKTKKGEIV